MGKYQTGFVADTLYCARSFNNRLMLLAFVCPSGRDKLIGSNYFLVIWHGFGFLFQIFKTNQDVFNRQS